MIRCISCMGPFVSIGLGSLVCVQLCGRHRMEHGSMAGAVQAVSVRAVTAVSRW